MATQCKYIWYDEVKNKHFMIDQNTGLTQQVYQTGDFIKEFDSSLTGQVTYQDRMQLADSRPQYLPHQPSSLSLSAAHSHYTPRPDKLLGYSQFPNPLCSPYFNAHPSLKKGNKRLQSMIKNVKQHFSPESRLNRSLYKHNTNQEQSLHFLTGSLHDHKSKDHRHGQVEVMTSRLPTTLTHQSDSTVKVINGQHLTQPNLKVFRKQQQLSSQKEIQAKSTLKNFNKAQHSLLSSLPPGQGLKGVISQSAHDILQPDDQHELDEHHRQLNETQAKLQSNMQNALSQIQSSTFAPNQCPPQTEPEITCMADYKIQFKAKQQELEGFKIPVEQQKNKVVTKNRFGTQIPSSTDLFRRDRALNRQVDPDLYKIKEVKKKRIFIDPITKKNVM